MSGLNPLKIALGGPRLHALFAVTAGLGLLWFAFLPLKYALLQTWHSAASGGELFLVVVAGAVGALLGHVFGYTLVTGCRVLGQHRVPTRMWHQWVQASAIQTLKLWAILAGGAATVLLPQQSPWHGLTGAAVVSLAVGLSALRTLASHGLAPRFWAWAGPLVLLCALAGFDRTGAAGDALHALDTLPWPILLGLAASWPIFTFALARRWSDHMPLAKPMRASRYTGVWGRMKRLFLRYTPLTAWDGEVYAASARYRRSAVMRSFWFPYLLLNPAFFAQSWGSAVPVWQLWAHGLVAIAASANLVSKDLHWRMLLAPAGGHCRALGWRIALSTATVYAMWLMVGGALLVAVVLLYLPMGFERVTDYLARFYLAPLQLVFVVAIGTMIRAGNRSKLRQFGLLVLWILAGGAIWIIGLVDGVAHMEKTCFAVGYWYVLGLFLVSASAIWLANRLWTVDKLLRSAPR
nr:hypothetical protein [Rhodoferax sp.]